MGAQIRITLVGLQEVESRLTAIGEKAEQNLVKQTAKLADDGKAAWKQATPKGKTGRLQGEEDAQASGLSAIFKSPTRYYVWVDKGHETPRGWRTRHGYRLAKRRSHVKGQEMTEKLVDWLKQNIREYLSKFLDGV